MDDNLKIVLARRCAEEAAANAAAAINPVAAEFAAARAADAARFAEEGAVYKTAFAAADAAAIAAGEEPMGAAWIAALRRCAHYIRTTAK